MSKKALILHLARCLVVIRGTGHVQIYPSTLRRFLKAQEPEFTYDYVDYREKHKAEKASDYYSSYELFHARNSKVLIWHTGEVEIVPGCIWPTTWLWLYDHKFVPTLIHKLSKRGNWRTETGWTDGIFSDDDYL